MRLLNGRIILLMAVCVSVEGFQTIFLPSSSSSSRATVTTTSKSRMGPLYDSKAEEIAKLEEQLRKLKEEKEEEVVDAKSKDDEEELEDITLEMFMTERWKREEAQENAPKEGGFSGILYGVAAVLALALFSQVPIGQEDLSKYSTGNPGAAQQIDLGDLNRARRSGDI